MTSIDRVRACGRRRTGDTVEVRTINGRAYFAGVQTCGSAWVCPVCAAKVRVRRAGEIEAGIRNWLAGGGGCLFVTFTVPHTVAMPLRFLLGGVAKAFSEVNSGAPRKRAWAAYGVATTIRSLEITRGANGWHPHLHVLYLTQAPLTAEQGARLTAWLRRRWEAKVVAQGIGRPGPGVGVVGRVVAAGDDGTGLGDYLSKLGLEVAAPDTKLGKGGSVTPFGLLRQALDTGESAPVKAWQEYEQATRRRQSITFGRGAYELLGLRELTDEELAAEQVGGEDVVDVPAQLWDRVIARIPGLRSELLDVVEQCGAERAREWLDGCRRWGYARLPGGPGVARSG